MLVGERGAYRQVQRLQTIQVPATVQAVLAARIDRLPPDEKRLLQTAAVVGTDFPFPLLQAVAEVPEAELRRSLTYLQAAELVYETRLFPELEYTFKHALTYQVAYESLLQDRRRELHIRIMEALEALYGERLSEQVERLAHHALRGELWAKALTYLQQAGEKAAARSAHVEAVSHLTTALELLKRLPDAPERISQELALQTALGSALMATKGYASPEVERAFARARELCRQVEETPALFRVLMGLHIFYRQRAELHTSSEVGGQLLALAQSVGDPQLLVVAHQALGTTLYFMGEFVEARSHLEEGITLYDRRQHRARAVLYGQDPGVVCLSTLAPTLWALGYPEQALKRLNESVALARELAHPFSLAFALYFAAVVYQYRQEWQTTQEHAEALMALSTEQGFAQRLAQGRILLGWTLVEQGRFAEGIAQLRQSVTAYGATGADLGRSSYLVLLAEAYGKRGQPEEGLAALTEALTAVSEHRICFNEAELHRLRGELLLKPGLDDARRKRVLRLALDAARRQQAKLLELRRPRAWATVAASRASRPQPVSCCQRPMVGSLKASTRRIPDGPPLLEALGSNPGACVRSARRAPLTGRSDRRCPESDRAAPESAFSPTIAVRRPRRHPRRRLSRDPSRGRGASGWTVCQAPPRPGSIGESPLGLPTGAHAALGPGASCIAGPEQS